jgi:hypothetical protein
LPLTCAAGPSHRRCRWIEPRLAQGLQHNSRNLGPGYRIASPALPMCKLHAEKTGPRARRARPAAARRICVIPAAFTKIRAARRRARTGRARVPE